MKGTMENTVSKVEELRLLVNSRHPIISVETSEEERIDALLGLLETVRRDTSFTDIVGLTRLRAWIAKRKSAFTPEGRKFGLEPPKGILITGVQGCGKSLAARSVAGEWGYELARLDAGARYDKFAGESERKLRKALELAQKMAPMVLWIDEIEKAFASGGSAGMRMRDCRNDCWRRC
jgi:SpoVK/Ycf46/Vps4 family AAA+-type ATPase